MSHFQIKMIGPDLYSLLRVGLTMIRVRSTNVLAIAKSFVLKL